MGRPVNPNVPEAGFVSKKQFEDTGSIAASDFAVVDNQDNSKEMMFDPSEVAKGKTLTLKAGAIADDVVITLPDTSGTLALEGGGASPGGSDTQVQYTVTGGGSNKVPVFSDGTNWIVG